MNCFESVFRPLNGKMFFRLKTFVYSKMKKRVPSTFVPESGLRKLYRRHETRIFIKVVGKPSETTRTRFSKLQEPHSAMDVASVSRLWLQSARGSDSELVMPHNNIDKKNVVWPLERCPIVFIKC